MDVEYMKAHLDEEISGAKDYVTKGINSNDLELIQMGTQEMEHANFWRHKLNDPAADKKFSDAITYIRQQLKVYGDNHA